jgi:inorganic pyrophosphatase
MDEAAQDPVGAAPRPDVRALLGQTVTVRIDRPLGSRHPRHADLVYPVNYGYVPGIMGGDGAALDAYVLGLTGPVDALTGVVIAVVLRADDVEDKLVVAPPGFVAAPAAIAAALAFQEQYFRSTLVTVGASDPAMGS